MRSDDPRGAITRDTIAAVATPAGRGAIGVVRVSGPAVAQIAVALLGRLPEPRYATLCRFRDAAGEPLDDGLALYFPAPNSYTGEPVLELQGHGGPIVMHAVLSACVSAGARLADPGEFTRRGFLAGKLDLAQAEAVADLIDASSKEAVRSALRSLSGEFSTAVRGLAEQLTDLRVLIEAMLDFPEEEIDAVHQHDANARLERLRCELAQLLRKSRQGSLLRSGVHVVLTGRPNVGKSSLLNCLAGEERAIVTPIAGTTRDTLREPVQIEGVPLVIVDTAGLRAATDQIEQLGMDRTRRELAQADVVLEVSEAGSPEDPISGVPDGAAHIRVFNKIDLVPGFRSSDAVGVSAKTGAGLQDLRAAILRAAGWSATGESVYLARARHLRALESAQGHLENAAHTSLQWELFADELRLAHAALGTITGELSSDELLGEIFARFCIGK